MFIEPVFGKKFFGREQVLATLHKRVTALKGGYRQNLALTGAMLAGKSSILRHFLMDIRDPDIIPIYIEMGDDDFNVFSERFMATLLYRYLRSEHLGAEGDFKKLKALARPRVPETMRCVDKISRALRQKKNDLAYEALLSLTSVFKTETGKSCIVILDEFHNLSNFRLKRPFQVFGKFIMIQKNTMYMVSSSQKTLLGEILDTKLSLLFGNFEVLEVRGFDNVTARSFLSDKMKESDPGWNVKDYIIQLSEGNPFYLEVLAERYVQISTAREEPFEPKECLLEAFADLLYRSEGVLNQYYTNNMNFFLEKKYRKKFIPLLVSMAKGNSTIKSIQKDMGSRDKDLGARLQKLQSMDLIYNSGVFYRISDRLFEFWLKNVYRLKTRSMIDDMDIKYLEFKKAVGEEFEAFRSFSSKGLESRIIELFSSFNNEKIRLRFNCRKMPRFDEVTSRSISDSKFALTGRAGNKEWICHVKTGDITDEHDICQLWEQKAGSERRKAARKIIIPLKGIEQNAFLLAKEQNIWVWGPQQLNSIMRLYGNFELVL